MGSYVLKRLLWMIPTLLVISLVTFLLMDLAPGDRALQETANSDPAWVGDAEQRARRIEQLRRLHHQVDPVTGQKLWVGERYWHWLQNALVLDFAGNPADSVRFREKIFEAIPVTLLLNALALVLAFAVAVPLGAHAGMRTGGMLDRLASGGAFLVYGVPEFLIATLLVLVFGGVLLPPMLPVVGIESPDAGGFGVMEKILDLLRHLCLPVFTLAVGYGVIVFRFLRESVARAAQSDFVLALRGFGVAESVVRARVLRNGLSPIVTILGTMLPVLVSGTVVIEKVFSIPGLGGLTAAAAGQRDMPMVMALTMLVSVATLVSLLVSDILQRVVDPRVSLR